MKCSVCSSNYDKPGALLFSPPDSAGKCMKYHICPECFVAGLAEEENKK